ncbi:uncharacterized protein EV422DRAFT_112692 [Fimicolochytrium jonesii]|uniref:uncharacterized protein n=1 Tax=Fimicolochytrium jonesii TaxID=1396493 RepID=UPI0022FE5C1E|nr:uncharacterized protein EV422DRAFT_112692 [Fimicolochytrium jonesii]KAI8819432.1 hypothetical protein EV422DRAFT_112692 [Fimicolochytrium jonesii]
MPDPTPVYKPNTLCTIDPKHLRVLYVATSVWTNISTNVKMHLVDHMRLYIHWPLADKKLKMIQSTRYTSSATRLNVKTTVDWRREGAIYSGGRERYSGLREIPTQRFYQCTRRLGATVTISLGALAVCRRRRHVLPAHRPGNVSPTPPSHHPTSNQSSNKALRLVGDQQLTRRDGGGPGRRSALSTVRSAERLNPVRRAHTSDLSHN